MKDKLTEINYFRGPWRFLSNFYPAPVLLDGAEYASVEHAYQAAKTLDPKQRLVFQYPSLTAGQAKSLGRRLQEDGKVRPDWRKVNVEIMHDLLLQKFRPTIPQRELLSTYTATLIEGNWWHDTFWGVCNGECDFGPHEPTGDNMLGQLLMRVRSFYGGA